MISRLAVLTLLCATINAQLQPYTSQPLIWQTFDTNPGTRPNTSRSLFSWARGNPPNTGIAVFNGVNNFIDLTYYADDRGSYFPTTLTRSFSLEYWIQFDAVNPWSRIFECGNGQGQDNINVANMDRTTNLAWSIDAGADGKQNTRVVANNAIMRGTFQHIVLTVEQQNASEITRGDLDVYVDGVLRATNRNAYLPRVTRRPDAWIGKSYYPGDGWFNGLLDDFFMYDHSISAEAVQAHYVLPRPPVYELTFSVDPRLISGRPFSEYKYKWSSDGAGNSSSTSKFGGYLLINGSDDHVDLALTSYTPAWVGTKAPLPQIGVVAETGANNTLPLGWTIELTFTPLTIENWAKVFDIGSGAPLDNIILGYEGSSNSLRFEYFIGTQAQETMNIASLAVDKSYHVVIVMIPSSITSTTGAIEIYVNGRPVDARNNIPMPRPVRRANAYIGRSHWASDEYFDCLLDSFRMYDYSLTGDEIQSLYEVTREAADQDLDPDSNVYRTGPTRQYTFRDAPPAAAMTNSAFQWAANLTNNATSGDWHRGIAVFNGSGQWIDLNRFPDDYGQGSIMPKFGNSVSFEVWARWSAFRRFSRIFDFGREFNSNAYSLILANTGSTNELLFESRNSQSQLSTVPSVRNALQLNRWIHIVVTVEQVSVNDSSSARAALYSVFINGVARESARGYLPFPTRRLSSYIGRSNYQADENFEGAIDSFMYYDYALQYEQIAAHHKLYKVPIFELAFSKDPRPWLGLTNATYAWEAYDPSDQQSNNTQFHNGHLVLMDKQWVNLTATTGQNSLGTAFAEAISGRLFGPPVYGAYSGPQSNTFRGWTIELLAKIMTLDNGAKLFSCASATRTNEVSIGWYGPNNLLALVVQQGTSEPVYFPFMDTRDLDPKAWYHFVVVANANNNYNNADYNVYVDGVRVHTRSGVTNPARVARPLCALGRSVVDPSSTQYFRAKIDTLRFIDYALSPSQVTELYDLTHDYLPPVVQPVYDTAPLIQYTFDDQPDSSKFIDGTYFSWERGTGVHQGIAKFNGVDQWINLISFPDDAGIPFPAVYGNSSFSFAAWVKFDGVRQWSRIFDSAAGTATDNVLLGMSANTTGLAFHVYRQDNTVNSQINTNPGVWKVGQWQHVVVTCSDRSRTNSSVVRGSSTQNLMQVFVDGRLVSERFGYLPRGVERPTTYLGKSHWVADQLMFGSIDSFYMYEYALSGEQVLLHAALPRPPVFDLSFAIDPRSLLPTSSVRWGYEWQEFDPSDSFGNGTAFHSGHVVLNHTRSDYINLSQLSGANTLGLLLPRIGGPSSGIGLTTPGWTFEWTIKINSVGAGRRIMDWGNGPTSNNIILGFGSVPNMLQFSVNSSSQLSTMDLLAVVPGEWIHIVVTLRPQSGSSDMSTWVGYVNGVQERTMTGVTPAPVRRNSALLGRSNAAGTPVYCSVNIDNIRVFDWVVSAQQVQTMYSISHDPSVDPVLPSSSSSTGGRGSSSSRAVSSSSGSRRTCTWGGNYPNCFCSCDTKFTTYPNCDHCDPQPPAAAGSGPLSFVEIVSLCVLILGVASMLGLCAFCFYRKSRMSGFSQFNNNLYDSEKNSVSMTSTRPGYDGSITNDASSTYDWRAAAAAEQDQNQWQGQQQDYQFGNQYQQPQY